MSSLGAVLLFVASIAAVAVPVGIPILYAALGEAVVERSGVINIGIEGMMLMGAWGTYLGAVQGHSFIAAIVAGLLAGALTAVVLAVFYVSLGTDQIVTGIVGNITAVGLTSFLYLTLYGSTQPTIPLLPPLGIPYLESIPDIGAVLFRQDVLVYGAILMAALTYLLMNKTWLGLDMGAVGEHPAAADSVGVRVQLIRYVAVVFGGIMAAAGGADLVLTQMGGFSVNATGGRGFIALAVVVLGKWNPLAILGGAAIFGLADALQLRLQAMGVGIPHEMLLMLPYLLTIAVLVGFVGGARYPLAMGVPYRR